jgi:hypothetical protein
MQRLHGRLLVLLSLQLMPGATNAQGVRTLDTGAPPGAAPAQRCATDSAITAALALFNSPAAVRVYGDVTVPAAQRSPGPFAVYRGRVRIEGSIDGDLIVLNGDARIAPRASVTGNVIVMGGRVVVDDGAVIGGHAVACPEPMAVDRLPDGTAARQTETRSLRTIASGIGVNLGPVRVAPYLGVGTYNRVEGLPLHLGARGDWGLTSSDSASLRGYGVVRTARDPSHSRRTLGWDLDGTLTHDGAVPLTLDLEGGSTVAGTFDRPFSQVESGLSALVFRRDYRDWYLRRGARASLTARPFHDLFLTAGYEISRQTSLPAVDAFSLFRSDEQWRPNPLIDDGKYHITSFEVDDDARNPLRHPVLSWYARVRMRRVTSDEITPVSLPATIRDAVPTSHYGSTDGDVDLRGYLRIDRDQRIDGRIVGGGFLSGDPLTIQTRRAIGGADPLAGYDFRSVNCERRRKADPAQPPLCDRELAVQLEYRHTLPIDLNTTIAGYPIGIHRPELVLFGDAGSAWLAGDSAGRVPSGKIQSVSEWKSDLGVGVSVGAIGAYAAKSLVDPLGVRFVLLFSRRF